MADLETPFPTVLWGNIGSTVTDPDDPDTPQNIIEDDDDFHVIVHWAVQGPMAPFLAGDFSVKVYQEAVAEGNAMKGQIGPTMIVPVSDQPPSNDREYQRDFDITAGTLLPGVYRLTTILTYTNAGIPMELAGFSEGPLIQIYHK